MRAEIHEICLDNLEDSNLYVIADVIDMEQGSDTEEWIQSGIEIEGENVNMVKGFALDQLAPQER